MALRECFVNIIFKKHETNKISLIIGFIGSCFLLIGSYSLGWFIFEPTQLNQTLTHLTKTDTKMTINIMVIVIGMFLLTHSWLRLGANNPSIQDIKKYLLLTILPIMFSLPMLSRDVFAYFAQGKLLNLNINPYLNPASTLPNWEATGIDPMWADTPTPYGPVFLLIAKIVANLTTNNITLMVFFFRTINLAAIIIIFYCTKQLCKTLNINEKSALWLILLNPLTLLYFTLTAHNDAILVAFMLLSCLASRKNKHLQAIIFLTLAVGIKSIALLLLPFIGIMWAGKNTNWLRLTTIWVFSSITLYTILAIWGNLMGIGTGWISTSFNAPTALQTWLAPTSALAMSINKFLALFNFQADFAITLIKILSLTLSAIIVSYLALTPHKRDPLIGATLAFITVLCLSPTLHPWYILWAIPLIVTNGMVSNKEHHSLKYSRIIISIIICLSFYSISKLLFINLYYMIILFTALSIIGTTYFIIFDARIKKLIQTKETITIK